MDRSREGAFASAHEDWLDPRTNPPPPHKGSERLLADDESELANLVAACRKGLLYDVEAWIKSGKPLQAKPEKPRGGGRHRTPLGASIDTGNHALVLLHLCNGYRTELETHSPLNDTLETRRFDILDLLLDWGADYRRASGIDRHHDVVRYAWEIRRDGELVLPGFDVTELDDEGRVLRVHGFFGPLPESES